MKHPIPVAFLNRIRQNFSENEFQFFVQSLDQPAVTSVRINPAKPGSNLSANERVPWYRHGYYLNENPLFTLDPLFHAGVYYPQEASSMVLWYILEIVANESGRDLKMLDLCGAPGGKATLMASFLNGDGLLVTNEVIQQRVRILRENIIKWGAQNVVVTQSDPVVFSKLPGFFDVMVVDAPCSGEGMFRKGDMARREWSEENARHCAVRQQRIIKDAWDTLKEGEWLIYSTCTYNANENEKNIKWLLNQTDAEVARLEVPDDWGIVGIPVGKGNALAFYPHSVKGEGFFIVLVQKNQSVKSLRIPKYKPQKIKTPADIRQLLKDEGLFAYFENEERWTAFPKYYEKSLMMLQNQLRVLYSGVTLANTRAKSLIPDIALALSWHYNAVYPVLELEQYDALRYLKGEMPEIRSGIQRGFILVTYNQIPLGFVKNVGNRYNNLYPKAWRIRMDLPGNFKKLKEQ